MKGVSAAGNPFESGGTLCNISARGSLGLCNDPPQEGMRVEVYISIPLGGGKQIMYSAEVVRVESDPNPAVALLFDTARPVFDEESSHAEATLPAETNAGMQDSRPPGGGPAERFGRGV